MDEQHRRRAGSFGRAAAEYDRGRPGYPLDAVEWMVPGGARTAVDVGAGTGKFTSLLVERGLEVTAVDPSDEMLERLRASVPGVATLTGTAEALPLPDSSVDLITSAQAWHWVDDERAFPEVGRVLKPGGTLALVWNFRDNRTGWMRQFADIITDRVESVEVGAVRNSLRPFAAFEHAAFDWTQVVTQDELIDLVVSRSIFLIADADEKKRVLSNLERLLGTHPDLVGRSTHDLPYRTHCFRAIVEK